jgi:hypothetical protein
LIAGDLLKAGLLIVCCRTIHTSFDRREDHTTSTLLRGSDAINRSAYRDLATLFSGYCASACRRNQDAQKIEAFDDIERFHNANRRQSAGQL